MSSGSALFIRLSQKFSDKLTIFLLLLHFLNDNCKSFEECPKGIAGLLPTFRQIVGAPAPERWGPLLEEVLQCHFDVVADLKFLTKDMTLEMREKVVIRVSQVRGIRGDW